MGADSTNLPASTILFTNTKGLKSDTTTKHIVHRLMSCVRSCHRSERLKGQTLNILMAQDNFEHMSYRSTSRHSASLALGLKVNEEDPRRISLTQVGAASPDDRPPAFQSYLCTAVAHGIP